jgi:hypothetical protein
MITTAIAGILATVTVAYSRDFMVIVVVTVSGTALTYVVLIVNNRLIMYYFHRLRLEKEGVELAKKILDFSVKNENKEIIWNNFGSNTPISEYALECLRTYLESGNLVVEKKDY